MAFGIYVHYPYCIQQCSYCDFATALHKDTEQDSRYLKSLVKEIQQRGRGLSPKTLSSIYLGGGTPSLMQPEQIVTLFKELEQAGFSRAANCEVSIEINPDTVTAEKLKELIRIGINRFSVGVQTFNDDLLRYVGRKHSSLDTHKTLDLLASHTANFSVDLLFGLPYQNMADMKSDLKTLLSYQPNHFSPYLLTLPEKHPLQLHRPNEEVQVGMLDCIYQQLKEQGFEHYEISNFSKPGFQSKHNLNAWLGEPYWGLGMSAHSYINSHTYGVRFSNPPTVAAYESQLKGNVDFPYEALPNHQVEFLQIHEALTDYNHTRLRLNQGINWQDLQDRFGSEIRHSVEQRLLQPKLQNLVDISEVGARLSQRGIQLSNLVFTEVVFLKEDLP